MPLTQGAKVLLGAGALLGGAYYAMRRSKVQSHARSREETDWPRYTEQEARHSERAVLENPSARERLSCVADVVKEHSKGAVKDVMTASGEIGAVVIEHGIEGVKDVGKGTKEVAQALLARDVPVTTDVRRTPPVIQPVEHFPPLKRDVLGRLEQELGVRTPGQRSRVAQRQQEEATHVTQQRAGQVYKQQPELSPPDVTASGTGLGEGVAEGVPEHALRVDRARKALDAQERAQAEQQAAPSLPEKAPARQPERLATSSTRSPDRSMGVVQDAAQTATEVGKVAAVHAQGAVQDVVQTGKESRAALRGDLPVHEQEDGRGIEVSRTPDLVRSTNQQPYSQTIHPQQQDVQTAPAAVAPPPSSSQSHEAGPAAPAMTAQQVSRGEGLLRARKEEAVAQARAILAQKKSEEQGTQNQPFSDRAAAVGQVLKEHAKAAVQDVKQAAGEIGTVVDTHGELTKRDSDSMSTDLSDVRSNGPVQDLPAQRERAAQQLQESRPADQKRQG